MAPIWGWPCLEGRLLLDCKEICRSASTHSHTASRQQYALCRPLAISEEQSGSSRRPDPQASAPTRSQAHVQAVISGPSFIGSSDQGSMQNGVGEQQYERVPREGLQLAELNGVETTSASSFEKLQPQRRASRRTNSRYAKRPTNLVAESCQVKVGHPCKRAPMWPMSYASAHHASMQHAVIATGAEDSVRCWGDRSC